MSHIFKVNIKLKYPIMVTFKYQMTFVVSRIIMLIKTIQMFYSVERGERFGNGRAKKNAYSIIQCFPI